MKTYRNKTVFIVLNKINDLIKLKINNTNENLVFKSSYKVIKKKRN